MIVFIIKYEKCYDEYFEMSNEFIDLYLMDDTIEKLLKDLESLLDVFNEYWTNFVYHSIVKKCIVVSLLHNKAPPVIIVILIQLISIYIPVENEKNKIIIWIDDENDVLEGIINYPLGTALYNFLSEIPEFEEYIGCNI